MSILPPRIPDADTAALGIGVGRLIISGGLFAAPAGSVRLLGVDSASAKRMTFLARMTAIRDLGLGVGTLVSRRTPQAGLWLGVGAVADGVDALVIAAATKRGVTRGLPAIGTVVGAVAAALGGCVAAQRAVRSRG